MSDVLTELVRHYGYLVVAVFLFFEGAGIPVPGETALVTAAAFAGRGTLSFVGVLAAGCLGTIAGSSAGFWIGVRGGHTIVARHGRWFGLNEQRMAQVHVFFERYGTKTVLIGRFVAFLRSFIGLFAGISGMSARAFTTYNVLGGVLWVGTFGTLGFVFGRNLPRLVRYLGRVSLLFAILVALVAIVFLASRWFVAHRAELVAEIDRRWARLAVSPAGEAGPKSRWRVWLFFNERALRGEYLAIHLLLGFGLSLATIGIFGGITEDIVETSPLTRFDDAVARRLHGLLSAGALRALGAVSALGSRSAMTLLFVVGAAILAVRRLGLAFATWCAAFVGAALLDASLRFVVRRSALPFAEQVLADWSTGIVSGHVLGVVVGYGMLAYLAVGLSRRTRSRTIIVAAATALVAGIAVARLYLGVHYISDEAAGIAAGLIWVTACVSGLEIARSV